MASPAVNFRIQNGGLGNSPASPGGTVAVLGCSSAGVANTVVGPYTDPARVTADNGYGPGPELVAALVQEGFQPLFVKTTSTTLGSSSAVTKVGTGVTVMTVSVATALDRYNAVITMVRSGTVGSDPEPGFTVSLDGGVSVSSEIRMPASGDYIIPNTGLTIHFTVATAVAGDTYSFTTVAPAWSNSDITSAVNALRDSNKLAGMIYLVGFCSAAAAGVYNTALSGYLTKKKFVRAVCETVDFASTEATWMTTVQNDYATFTSDLISVAATPILYPSALSGVNFRRSIGFPYILRLAKIAISKSAGEVLDGALANVKTVYHDEALVPGLDNDRFVTATSIPGLIGYYITRANLMRGVGSDFSEMQYGRVMDEACRIAYNFFVQRLNSRVRLNPKTGLILEKDARSLESGCNAKLSQGIVQTGDASTATTVVSRVDNISTTKTLTVTIRVLPVGYIQDVEITMTFENPALGG
jgi:hypothetical protein